MKTLKLIPFLLMLIILTVFAAFYDMGPQRFQQIMTLQLIEERKLRELITAEYRIKLVFPHDFLPAGRGIETYHNIMKKAAEKIPLSKEEEKNIRVYIKLDRLGRPFDKNPTDFFITELLIRAGYKDIPQQGQLGKAEIIEARIEENIMDKDFPDIRLSAEQYREISKFILANYEDIIPLEEIKKQAEDQARQILLQLDSIEDTQGTPTK
ncbi:hypothetical protein WKV44_02060 [Spirochaetia bacterium 38H-sp]|uniref:Uncharacterized protein n=1 Tax=Rarispira pelagica TaxID=3141764 RepID=A0ABU9U9I5_9SPIR